jgi:hypothetical protein
VLSCDFDMRCHINRESKNIWLLVSCSEVYVQTEGDVRDNIYQEEIRSDTDSMCLSPSL